MFFRKKHKEAAMADEQTAEQANEQTEQTEQPQAPADVTVTAAEFESLKKRAEATDAVNDKYLRLYADFENSKKMWDKQKAEYLKFGAFNLMKDFSSVLDDIEAANATLNKDAHPEYARGLEMVYTKITNALTKNGLKEVDAMNKPFDPHAHEALMFVERADVDEHTVVGIIQKGYLYEDKLLRPARVTLSRKPVQPAVAGNGENGNTVLPEGQA